MKRKSLLVLFFTMILFAACSPADRYVSFSGFAQGGVYSVTINMKDVDIAEQDIKKNVDKILSDIDKSLSGYNKNSLLASFNSGKIIIPDEIFLNIYESSYEIYDITHGAVDVAAGPLFDLWGFGFKNSQFPDSSMVSDVRSGCGMRLLSEDIRGALADDGSLSLVNLLADPTTHTPQLNYNAVAQGYSCDLVAEYLYEIGVRDMLVNIGEIYCAGKNPSGNRWVIGIDRPFDGNNQAGKDVQAIFSVPEGEHGVVTSGNYRKFYLKDGKKYPHTIDPRTGYPVSHNLLSATIVAPDAMTADAYATYCMVVGLEAAQAFIMESPDLEGCLIYDEGGDFKIWTSDNFMID